MSVKVWRMRLGRRLVWVLWRLVVYGVLWVGVMLVGWVDVGMVVLGVGLGVGEVVDM